MQSEEEKIRYDRQVRLWGANTQQQICATQLCVVVPPEVTTRAGPSPSITPTGFTGEVCKNLVLAGIKGIHLAGYTSLDDQHATSAFSTMGLQCSNTLTNADMTSNFYARRTDSVDTTTVTRHASMAAMMQDLNPFVSVSTSDANDDSASNVTMSGNVVSFEQFNLLALAAGNGASTSIPTRDPSCTGIVSSWACLAMGPFVLVSERTQLSQQSSRQQMRQRLLDLLDGSRSRCAALPTPARVIGLTFALLRVTMQGMASSTDATELLCHAHEVVETWGLAINDDVQSLTEMATSYACEILAGVGVSVSNTDLLSLIPRPAPSVIDASVSGGLIAQRIINAISTPMVAGTTTATDNVFSLCTSGQTVEAFVSAWPSL